MTYYYLAVRAYGDCLISLSLLRHLPAQTPLKILGTPITTRIARVVNFQQFPITEALADVAAFYDLRVRGPLRAANDLYALRRQLAARLARDDTVIFEHRDWRTSLIMPMGRGRSLEPPYGRSIYDDRHALLSGLFGTLPPLEPSLRLPRNAAHWVVNPGARQPVKALPPAVVRNVLAAAAERNVRVTLLDPELQHAAQAAHVSRYEPAPSLDHAVNLLRGADAYIGADSLFLHLAYFLHIPLFAIPRMTVPYFAPPGMIESCSFLPIADAMDPARFTAALEAAMA